jgi:hypothetical protein
MMTFSRAASRSEELMQASFFSRSIGALTLFVMLLTTMTAWAETVNNVSYREYDTSTKVFEDKTCPSATVVESSYTTLGADNKETWYVVDSYVTFNKRITFKGTVHLILADNTILDAKKGITTGSALYIYAQSEGAAWVNSWQGTMLNISQASAAVMAAVAATSTSTAATSQPKAVMAPLASAEDIIKAPTSESMEEKSMPKAVKAPLASVVAQVEERATF